MLCAWVVSFPVVVVPLLRSGEFQCPCPTGGRTRGRTDDSSGTPFPFPFPCCVDLSTAIAACYLVTRARAPGKDGAGFGGLGGLGLGLSWAGIGDWERMGLGWMGLGLGHPSIPPRPARAEGKVTSHFAVRFPREGWGLLMVICLGIEATCVVCSGVCCCGVEKRKECDRASDIDG